MNTKQARIIIGVVVVAIVISGIWLFSRKADTPPQAVNATQKPQIATSMQQIADKAAETIDEISPDEATQNGSSGNATAGAPKTQPAAPAVAAKQAQTEPAQKQEETTEENVEDDTIRLSFIDNLSAYLVAGYQPPKSRKNPTEHGRLAISYKQVNMHYGLDPSLFGNPGGAAGQLRKAVLDYAFQPGMLKSLYTLYADSFVDQMSEQAQTAERSFPTNGGSFANAQLNAAQSAELLTLYADRCSDAARVFKVMAKEPELNDNVERYLLAARNVNTAYEHFWKRDLKAPSQVELAGKEIKQAIVLREELRSKVIQAIRNRNNLNNLSDEQLLYLAQWGHRRSMSAPQPTKSLDNLSEILTDLGKRLKAEAQKIGE